VTAGSGLSAGDLVADRAIADLSETFRFLLDVTPVNIEEARAEFAAHGGTPAFEYRPLEDSVELTLTRLDRIAFDEVRDATVSSFLIAKRRELALQLQMLACRGTGDFRASSIELYGTVGPALLAEADEILGSVEPTPPTGPWLDATEIVRLAEIELGHYRAQLPDLEANVEIRTGTAGLMVSNGDLLVSPTSRISAGRIAALLHHEIGTHVVTHVNGAHQPLRVLASGLAGHDETQEGLAVLAEYLVGGLDGSRLRQLAARVVAVHDMLEGATFADVHHRLVGRGISWGQAFTVTLRVFRSGGLTKDAIYLRGLRELIDHLAEGGPLETLWLGKMSLAEAPLVADLHARGILVDPVLRPRFLTDPTARRRLADLEQVTSLSSGSQP
jgi:uncharacterized protein (TIGR02421 family)